MPQISAIIITYNEEKNIERCIRSLEGIADEIIVVDSYSTDQTIYIASGLGAIIYQNDFAGYIEQKNFALTKSSFPHVLSLDADEELSEQLRQSVLKVKADWSYDGYYFNRLSNYCGTWIKHGSWYPSRKLRLWDKRKGTWGGVNPHDIVIMQKGVSKKFLKGDLKHYPYYTKAEFIRQIYSFSEIFANSHFVNGTKATIIWLIIKPIWRFFRDYLLKLGFLDGKKGLTICILSSFETFLKYRKLFLLYKTRKNFNHQSNQHFDFKTVELYCQVENRKIKF